MGAKLKIFLGLVVMLVFNLLLVGCRQEATQPQMNSNKGSYSVVDYTGQKLEFSTPPKRIISLSVSVDEILLDLLPSERIVALTGFADDAGISSVADKAKAVKGRVKTKGIEEILSLAPDLIIAPDWLPGDVINGLKGIGVKVYVFKTPVTIKEIRESIYDIAAVTGDRAAGDKLVKQMDQKLDNIAQRVGDIKEKKTVVAFSLMGAFGGKGTSFDDICTHAYVNNGVSKIGIEKYDTITKELIVAINPDVFILPTWDYKGDGETTRYIEEIKTDPAYRNVQAIRNNNLIKVNDAKMYSTSHYIVDSVEEVALKVYPEKF